jgi:glycosyltransferase involved in cell wall biosynthesis
MNPKISVVLSTFNHMQYLPRAIHSILNQLEIDYEFLILDDGSTDDTNQYLTSEVYFSQSIRIFRHKKNLGVQKSYYELLSKAKGDYLIFIHSDDLYTPDMLSELSKALDENPEAGLAYGAFDWIDEKENILRAVVNQYVSYHSLLVENPGLSAVLFRRDIYKRVGGYDQNIGCRADQDLYLRIIEKSKAVYVNKILSQQRLDQNCKSLKDQVTGETEESLERLRENAVERRRKNRSLDPARILFIDSDFSPDTDEIDELYVYESAKNLIEHGYDVFILRRIRGESNFGLYENIKIYELGYNSDPSLLMNSVEDKVGEEAFIKFLDQVPPFDIFHFHHIMGFPFSFIDIVKKCGYPAILTLQDAWTLCPRLSKFDFLKESYLTVDNCAKCILSEKKDQYVNEIAQTYYGVAYRRAYLEYVWRKIDLITIPEGILFDVFNRVGLGKKIQQTDPNVDMWEDCLQWEERYQKLLK